MKIANLKPQGLIAFCATSLLAFSLTACLGSDQPMVLSSEGGAVEEGTMAQATPGEAPAVAVEEAELEALVTEVPTEEDTEEDTEESAESSADATATPEGIAAVPEEGAAAEEGLAAEIGFSNVLVSTNYFIHRDVENMNGDVIADVDDLLIDLNTGRILYVIVNYGDFLDLTTEDRPMPLSAFGWNNDLELVLRLPEDVLDDVPAVEDEWPNAADENWNGDALGFWEGAEFALDISPDAAPVRVTELIGLHAGQLGQDLGVLEDVLLDLSSGQIAYLSVFTTDDFYSPDLVLLVPMSAADMTIEAVGDEAVYAIALLEIDEEVLRSAPALDRSIYNSVAFVDATFTNELNAYWTDQGVEVGATE